MSFKGPAGPGLPALLLHLPLASHGMPQDTHSSTPKKVQQVLHETIFLKSALAPNLAYMYSHSMNNHFIFYFKN